MEVKSYTRRDISKVLEVVSMPDKRANDGMLRQVEKKKRLAECDRQAQKLVEKILDIFAGG